MMRFSETLYRRLPLAIELAALCLIPLMACQTMGSGVTRSADPQALACLAFKPIRWSKLDTIDTQDQARQHNAAGVALCGWRP